MSEAVIDATAEISGPKWEDTYGEWFGYVTPGAPERWTMLVYGPSGSGKTVFAASWPDVIVVDLEDGMASVREPVARFPTPGARVDHLSQVQSFLTALSRPGHPFRTVVIDGLNELQHLTMQRVLTAYNKSRPYDDQMTLADFGKSLNDLERVCRQALALPMNVVFTCQATDRVNETDLIQPMLVGKNVGKVVSRLVDLVGYATVQRDEKGVTSHELWFHQPQYVTKDRTGRLPSQLRVPEGRGYESLMAAAAR